MSQALENKEETEKNQQARCVKCQASQGSDNFEKLCTNCLNQNKVQEESIIKQTEKNTEEQVEFTTPTKCVRHEITIQREKELIEAPRKQRMKRNQFCESQETQGNQEPSLAQTQKNRRKMLNLLRERLKQNEQWEQKMLNKEGKEEQVPQNNDNFPHQDPKQPFRLEDLNDLATKSKQRPTSTYQTVQETNDPQLKPKKRTYQEVLEVGRTIKGRCSFCKKKTGLLGVACSHCSHEFCNSHRLPEDHECKVDFSQNARVKMRAMVSNILPKHKGKIAEI